MKRELFQLVPGGKWAALLTLSAGLTMSAGLAGCGGSGAGALSGAAGSAGGDQQLASVGGRTIMKSDLDSQLEAMAGVQAMQTLIQSEAVSQEALKEGVEVSDEDLTAAMNAQARNNPNIARAMQIGGPSLDALKRETRVNLMVSKLLIKDVPASDAEIKAYFDKNHARYDIPPRAEIGIVFTSTKLRADTMEDQLKNKTKTFTELVDQQKKANDGLGRGSIDHSPYIPIENLPTPEIIAATKAVPLGGFSQVLPLHAPGRPVAYAIIRVNRRDDGTKANLSDPKVKADISDEVKQIKVAHANGGKDSNPQSMGEAVQIAMNGLVTKIITKANIQITDTANYPELANQFNKAPAAGAAAGSASAGAPVGNSPGSP